MATEAQIHANRRNALKSTGPKTSAGKSAVRLNALWHGGFATDLLLPGEDTNLFNQLTDSFRAQHRPAGPAEEFLVDRMVLACWRLRRLAAMEVRVLRCESGANHELRDLMRTAREAILGTGQPSPPPAAIEDPIARAYIRDCNGANTLSKLARYQTALERSFYRSAHELERLRAARVPSKKSKIPAPVF